MAREKCENHSGVCAVVEHLQNQTESQWSAIKDINNKLWMILILAAAGAIGTLVNLFITQGMK